LKKNVSNKALTARLTTCFTRSKYYFSYQILSPSRNVSLFRELS
jgi:hypothetical protein